MKKRLLFINALLCGLILPASAQYTSTSPIGAGRAITLPSSGPVTGEEMEDLSRAVSCTDKVTYADRYPASPAAAYVGGVTGFDVVLQEFPEYVGQVTKVDFQASNFTAGTKTVNVFIYNNTTFAALATGTVNINSTTTANYSVTFATPANVNASANGFLVGIWAPTGDSIKVHANTDGDGEGHTFAQVGTTLYSFLNDFGFDVDLLVRPTVKFNHSLTPTLSATPSSACTGASVSFNGNYTGTAPAFYYSDLFQPDGLAYDTDYGDATTHGTSMTSSHTYSTPGTKNASFKVVYQGWTADCPSDPATQTVTVNPAPYAFFSWEATGLSVEFTNMSVGATSYAWAFGDGGTATAPSPVHNYAADGTYTVELTATGTCGTDAEFTNITIATGTNGGNVGIVEAENGLTTNIYPNPASSMLNIDLSLAKVEEVSLQVISAMGQLLYSKELGSINASLQTIDLSSFENGVYFVRVVHNNTISSRSFVKQ